ncbi:MAG TPA: NUDIX domain-containing protein [Candidatus Thermoplasmatota archaeon]|nr:NUDIX domain-containing protein [Candidatus Thermoplasmatota archaeon]
MTTFQPTRIFHCRHCGGGTEEMAGQTHRLCRRCGQTTYVNPAPAVGVAILRGREVLLSLRAHEPKAREWDLVGGFVEAGETPEDAILREAWEETTCTISEVKVHKVEPGDYAGQPTLNFLATARIEGEPRAMDDSLELRWWPLDALPPLAWPHEEAFLKTL